MKSQAPRFTGQLGRSLIAVLITLLIGSSVALGETTIGQETAVITSDTTWGAGGSPYILTRDVEVRSQATLTIEPGVEVRFETNDQAATNNASGVEIVVRGAIRVMGTELDPVVFTGQDLSGPAQNATGLIFTVGARGSELHYTEIRGLAYGVRQEGDMSLLVDDLSINATHVAFMRQTGGSDLVLSNAMLVGGTYALDLASLNEDVLTHINQSYLEGGLRVRAGELGGAGFNTEMMLRNTLVIGDVTLEGNLQAGAEIELLDTTIQTGTLRILGDVNTNAQITLTDSAIDAPHSQPALVVEGSILSDASVTIERSNLDGSVQLGPVPSLGGEGEGQYFLMSEPATWSEAAANCAAMGGKLADAQNLDEARNIFHAALGGQTSQVWVGGSIEAPDCEAGASFVEVTDIDDCREKADLGFPVRTVTEGYDCACNLNCPLRSETRNSCFIHNFSCFEDATFSARLPECDASSVSGEHCYSHDFTWRWEDGSEIDHIASPWAEGETDRLTCLGESPNLQDELHIVVDTQDASGGLNGELGLWRARVGSSSYSYVCEGRVGTPATQEVSRGTISINQSSITGAVSIRAGVATLFESSFERGAMLALYRGGSVIRNIMGGALNVASRDQVEVTKNKLTLTNTPSGLNAGGGIFVESEHAIIYGNEVDGGSYGIVIRGTAEVGNNLITRIEKVGIQALTTATNAGREVVIANNTLIDAYVGLSIEGQIDVPATHVHNNNVYRGSGVGIQRLGAAPVVMNHNNVFAYDTLYSGVIPDVNSVSANPGFVADFPAETPIFRLDSGSPLIDIGRCDLTPVAPASEGGLRVDIDGIPRPFDGDFDGDPSCDIGAYEFGPEEIFIYVDGALANSQSFATGLEVELTLWGRRDARIFPVTPAVWTILEAVGTLNEDTDQFRPGVIPGFFASGIQAQFGNLHTSLDIELACGCPTPDRADGSLGECNGVPECYDDWTCPVRENYCQVAEMGSLEDPLTVAAENSEQIRAGARDAFGFVFKHPGPFTYEVINGGGSADPSGLFTADSIAGDYGGSLRITSGSVSGVSDIKIVPNVPAAITISRATQSVQTTRTLLHSALVSDAFGNAISDAEVSWSIGSAGGSTIDPVTGRVTAGCEAGLYPNAVTASFGGVSSSVDLIVNEGGAVLERIDISPASLTIPATTQANFSATVTDRCGFTRPAANPQFSVVGSDGSIEGDGTFTAGCQLGDFIGAVVVQADNGLQTTATLRVTGAPLKSLSVQPATALIRMNSSAEFEAVGVDQCDRLKVVEPLWSTTITNGTVSSAGLAINGQRLTVGCSDIAIIAGGLRANYTDEFGRVFSAAAAVEVQAGEVFELTIPDAQVLVSLPAGNEMTLQANAVDICGNSRQDALQWSASNGNVHPSTGVYTAGCTRGIFPNAIFVQAGQRTRQMSVEVTDGVLNRIEILPSPVTARAGETLQLNAQLFDGCNNVIDREPVWRNTEGGSMTLDGVLTASQEARTYFGSIVAELDGIQAVTDLVVNPAGANILEVSPDPFIVAAGSMSDVEVTAFDQYGNPFTPEVVWTVNPNAGRFNDEGKFIAGTVVDTYVEGLIARVGTAELEVDVEVVAGPVAALNIQPNPVEVDATESIQLTALPVDQFDNEVVNVPITWSVEAGGGQINAQGVFTASNRAGTYQDSIVASGGGIVQQVSAIVRPSAAVRLALIPNPLVLTPESEGQLSLSVFDAHDNVVTPANVVYAVGSGGEHFTVSPTGLVRALQTAGDGVIQVNSNGLTTNVNLTVIPGAVSQIRVQRPEQNELVLVQEHIQVRPGEVIALTATPLDAFDNPVATSLTWSTSVDGFGVTASGVFTAGLVAGEYPNALRVRHLDIERLISVTVVPGAPVSLHVEPEVVRASPGTTQQLNAYFTDAQGNIVDPSVGLRWTRTPSASIEISSNGLLQVDCSVGPEYYSQVISVSTLPGSPIGQLTAVADVEVTAGVTSSVSFSPIRYEVAVNNSVSVFARAEDACGYPTVDVPVLRVTEGGGAINAEGTFTASIVAEEVTLTASVGELSANATVSVRPGAPVLLRIAPSDVSVVANESQEFTVEAEDEFGNLWSPLTPTWQVRDESGEFGAVDRPNQEGPVGLIDSQGVLDVTTVSQEFQNHVAVDFGGLRSLATVYVEPAAPNTVTITPENETFIPNQIKSFTATVSDVYGNLITNVVPIFEIALPEAGVITDLGLFTASDNVGVYTNAITARVGADVVGAASVEIVNSEPARIEIDPPTLITPVASSPNFTATVYDTEDVVIERATVTWSVNDENLGSISEDNNGAQLTVRADQPNNDGDYRVIATIETTDGMVVRSTATVFVPFDYDGDGVDDTIEHATGLNPSDVSDAEEDEDDDGLTNGEEVSVGLDHRDADSDDDGILDGAEELWNADSDGDTLINALDSDSDGDGIPDGVEAGISQPTPDTQRATFKPDADSSTTTNPLNVDSDGDGIPDGEEDSNQNGRLDPGETPANRDLQVIACDASLPETGCPADLICLENVCAEPSPEPKPQPEDGCDANHSQRLPWILVIVGLFCGLRRRRASTI